jgi:hypothetical protein
MHHLVVVSLCFLFFVVVVVVVKLDHIKERWWVCCW